MAERPPSGIFIRKADGTFVRAGANPDVWKCGPCQSGTGTCCTRKDVTPSQEREVKKSTKQQLAENAAAIEKAREHLDLAVAAQAARLKKEAGGGTGLETETGRANRKRHDAIEEVERIANGLLDAAHGSGQLQPSSPSREPGGGRNQSMGAELKHRAAIAQALLQVPSAVAGEYLAYVAGLPADPGGAAETGFRDMRKIDLAKALQAYADAVTDDDAVGGTPFAKALRQARLAKGLSQAKLAEMSLIHVNSINNYENSRTYPDALHRRALEEALSVTLPLR